MERWTPGGGTPPGAVLSPGLATIYRHPLDKLITTAGLRRVRYADDFVMLCQSQTEAEAALQPVQTGVTAKGLTLIPDQTHRGDCCQAGPGFELLGYRFEAGQRWVRNQSRPALRDQIRDQTRRHRSGSMTSIIQELNAMLKGWFNDFQHAYRTEFAEVDQLVRRRRRALVLRRNPRKGWGHRVMAPHRWKNAYFASIGLFT